MSRCSGRLPNATLPHGGGVSVADRDRLMDEASAPHVSLGRVCGHTRGSGGVAGRRQIALPARGRAPCEPGRSERCGLCVGRTLVCQRPRPDCHRSQCAPPPPDVLGTFGGLGKFE